MDEFQITNVRRQSLLVWGLFCIVAGCIFLIYASVSINAGDGDVIMPLDDAYIHFQYGRQMALGDPYVYNPGDDPTSGATSFIYPYILATGHILGFHDLNLGYWAMGVGALTLLGSMWLIFHILHWLDASQWLAIAIAVSFGLTGAISWHFMSGMETGLMILLSLATLYGFISQRFNLFWISATLLAITRPEGSMMAGIAVVLYAGREIAESVLRSVFVSSPSKAHKSDKLWLLVLPLGAIFIQPMLNFALTGSFSASGNQAKSILSMIPFDWRVVIERIVDQLTRMWEELATGLDGYFTPVIVAPLALIGWVLLLRRSKYRLAAVLILLWTLVVSGAIATLDTAFWHFKRYQMPLIALLFPLAGIGLMGLLRWVSGRMESPRLVRLAGIGVVGIVIGLSLMTGVEFLRLYQVNVNNVVVQPLAMARWIESNTPEDAVIAVHDVGMMRYMGGRTTLDMVGLTTEGAADAWRNGPGAVAEFLLSHDPQPDYVASYTTARGLNYLADTPIYGELLAEFPAQFAPEDNVALAADYQGIFRYEASFWLDIDIITRVYLDALNVANIEDEASHDYQWEDSRTIDGFNTEVYELRSVGCDDDSCLIIDGGRRINGEESFTLEASPNEDALLITRLHPVNRGTLQVYVDDVLVDTQWIPPIPGRWLLLLTYISAELIQNDTIRVRIEADTPDGHYMPYFHFLTQPFAPSFFQEIDPVVSYQEGAFSMSADYELSDSNLEVMLDYQVEGETYGEYKVFVHVYGDDINTDPAIQRDMYPLDGSLPVGNLLIGTFPDTIMLDLSDLPSGQYTVAVGFYEPTTFERLTPELLINDDQYWVDDAGGRLFIGEVEIP